MRFLMLVMFTLFSSLIQALPHPQPPKCVFEGNCPWGGPPFGRDRGPTPTGMQPSMLPTSAGSGSTSSPSTGATQYPTSVTSTFPTPLQAHPGPQNPSSSANNKSHKRVIIATTTSLSSSLILSLSILLFIYRRRRLLQHQRSNGDMSYDKAELPVESTDCFMVEVKVGPYSRGSEESGAEREEVRGGTEIVELEDLNCVGHIHDGNGKGKEVEEEVSKSVEMCIGKPQEKSAGFWGGAEDQQKGKEDLWDVFTTL